MASYDINKVNLSLLKQYRTFFDNENSYYNTASYNTFLSSYLNNCSDPFIQNMSTILKRDYEQIKKGYNSIGSWWSSYNSGVEALEEKLATCIFQSVIDETINNLDSLSLMEYSSFYDGLLSAYNDIFINNIGLTDFSLDKLRTLSEENIVVKNFITLYPEISRLDPIEARNIINSLMSGNVTNEQIVSNVSNIISTLAKTGEIEKIKNLITATQSKDTVIIFNFRDLIKNNPEYKDQLETIYKDYKEYQSRKHQEMINEMVLKEDIEAFNEYIRLTSFISYNYNEIMNYLMKNGQAKKAYEMISMLTADLDEDYVNFDDVLKSFVNNYSSEEIIDLLEGSKINGDVIMINIGKLIEYTKNRDDYDRLEKSLTSYLEYQKEKYKEQILNKIYTDSLNFPASVIEAINVINGRAGIELDIDYTKETVNMFLNGMEERAFTFADLIKYDKDKFKVLEFINLLVNNEDIDLLLKFLDASKKYKKNIILGNDIGGYLEYIELQDYNLYLKLDEVFNNYFSSCIKEKSSPEAYNFFIKTLKESNNPLLTYLSENLYLLCNENIFSIVLEDNNPHQSSTDNQISLTLYSLQMNATNTLIHELGHCLFTTMTNNNYPLDYIEDPDKYEDRLLMYDDGCWLNQGTIDLINSQYNGYKIAQEKFKRQQGIPTYNSIHKEITEFMDTIDMAEVFPMIEDKFGCKIEQFILYLDLCDELTLNGLSKEKQMELVDDFSKEKITETLINYRYTLESGGLYRKYTESNRDLAIINSSSDIICSVLRGKIYQNRETGENIQYIACHSESYYKEDKYGSFAEQIANFAELKFLNAAEELQKLRVLLGDDWYNMMNDTYNQMVSKLGGNN